MKDISCEIYGKRSYYYRSILKENGFKFIKKSYGKSYWQKKIASDEVEVYKKMCNENNLKYRLINYDFKRSSNYRKTYLDNKKPILKKYYFCSYCKKIFSKNDITVDHIFPVQAVSNSLFLQKVLKVLKINGVNDYRNLTACCKSCNSRKGSKTGLWVIRGFLGKSNVYCMIVNILKLIISIFLIYFLYKIYFKGEFLWILKVMKEKILLI